MMYAGTSPERISWVLSALRAAGATLPAGESLHVAVLPVESFT